MAMSCSFALPAFGQWLVKAETNIKITIGDNVVNWKDEYAFTTNFSRALSWASDQTKQNRQQQLSVPNYREQIDLQWTVNLSSAYFFTPQFTKWASSIVNAQFFRLHFYCPFHLLCSKSQPMSVILMLRMVLCVIYGRDGAALICECDAIGGLWVDIITRKNSWSQIQAISDRRDTFAMDASCETHTAQERFTNFEYVNKLSVYDIQHNVIQLSASTMSNDDSDSGHEAAISIFPLCVLESSGCFVSNVMHTTRW